MTCKVTPKLWKTDYPAVDYVSRPGALEQTRAIFVVEAGKAGLQPGVRLKTENCKLC